LGWKSEALARLRVEEEEDLKHDEPQDRLQGAINLQLLFGLNRQGGEKPRRWNMTSTDGAGKPKTDLQVCRE
jgi:hypothetical protein